MLRLLTCWLMSGSFSALQRAEIAEIVLGRLARRRSDGCFSALQRAEIAEMMLGRIVNLF